MSRKTRKLIWSAPLVAVLAVAGVLAMFVALEPGSVFANPLPGAPMDLDVNPASGNTGRITLVLTWDAPAGGNVTNYRIDKSVRGFVWETMVAADDGHTMTTYMDGTLTASDTRWYRVFAVNDHGLSPVSNAKSGKTNVKGKPSEVLNLAATPNTRNGRKQIDLSWNPPADNGGEKIVGYEVQYYDSTEWKAVEANSAPESLTMVEKPSLEDALSLDPGETRLYQVRALNTPPGVTLGASLDHRSNWNDIRGTTRSAVAPDAPTGLTAVNADVGDINLYWFAPENNGGFAISHYLIQAKRQGTTWPAIPEDDDLPDVVGKGEGDLANTARNYTFRTEAAAANGLVQKSFAEADTVYDKDGDAATTADNATPWYWEFRVYALTYDDGPDNSDQPNADDVLRRSSASSSSDALQALARLDPDDLAPPSTFTATGDSFTDVDGNEEKKINLTITYETATDTPNSFRVDYSDDLGENWKSLVQDTRFTQFGDEERVYTDDYGLGDDERRSYRIFVVGDDWLDDVGPAKDPIATGYTAASTASKKVEVLTASAPDLDTIVASWTAPDNGGQPIVKYHYRYVQDDGDGQPDSQDWESRNTNQNGDVPTGTIDGNVTSATIQLDKKTPPERLVGEKLYHFEIVAVNKPMGDAAMEDRPPVATVPGELWSKAASFSTGEATVPGPVEGLTSEVATDASGNARGVNLLWNKASAGSEPTTYVVERKIGGDEWENPQGGENVSINRTLFTDPRHYVAEEQLAYRVRGENTTGEGDWVMVYYPRDPAADHSHVRINPSNLMVTVDGTTVSFTWTDGSGTTGHTVGLVDLSDYSVPHEDTVANGVQMHEYTNVAPGRYMVAVLGTPWMSKYYDIEFIEVMSGN